MSGIVFFGSGMVEELKKFYTEDVGCVIWLEQADCVVLKHDNFLFGFCAREKVEKESILCFFFEEKKQVDIFYEKFQSIADAPPQQNNKYGIYHFFAVDPEGRRIEFQHFNKTPAMN